MKLPKTIRLTERKLGREKASGQVEYGRIPHITLDPRQKPEERLDTLVHELIHIVWPEIPEEGVVKAANRISSVIWSDGWRRIQA